MLPGYEQMNDLTEAEGKIPAENKKQFKEIVNALLEQWNISKPAEIMLANRLVSSWMRMRYIETCLKKYGLFFEDMGDDGKVNRIRMNDLANYLRCLESDVRSYYRLLNQGGQLEDTGPKDFMQWLDETDEKKTTKKNRSKKNKK